MTSASINNVGEPQSITCSQSMASSSNHPNEISEALKNESVARLWEEVNSSTLVTCLPSSSKLWASETSSGLTTIHYARTKRPAEALAHELLHAKLKISGYRQYIYAVAKKPCPDRKVVIGDRKSVV